MWTDLEDLNNIISNLNSSEVPYSISNQNIRCGRDKTPNFKVTELVFPMQLGNEKVAFFPLSFASLV
jgi:hypothetical protein